jgi:DNA primase
MFIDFKEVKRLVSVERAMIYLSLKGLKAEQGSYRGECPSCKDSGSRALVITPEKESFYCHHAKKGGDVISLVAHLHGTSMKESASWLLDRHGKTKEKATVPQKKVEERPKSPGISKNENPGNFQPLSHLQFDHENVRAIGISAEDAERLGIGYTARGLLKGHVCIPVRLEDGTLSGYVGIQSGKVPKEWHGLKPTNVVPLKKRA